MKVSVSTYVGDGQATKAITGVGFQPKIVWVKNDSSTQVVVARTNSMPATDSKAWGGSAYGTDGIRSLDANGFTVGNNARVNTDNDTYRYIAWADGGEGDLAEAGYAGNGNDNRSITGAGFQPDFVLIFEDGASRPQFRHKDDVGDTTHGLDGDPDITDAIQTFEADGFQVGTHSRVNQNGENYEYMAMVADSGVFAQGTFTGDGAASKAISGLGFQPDVVIIKNDTTDTSLGVFTTSESGVNNSHHFSTVADASGLILSLDADGFTVGSDDKVNKNGDTIMWMAWAEAGIATTTTTSTTTSTSTSSSTSTSTSSSTTSCITTTSTSTSTTSSTSTSTSSSSSSSTSTSTSTSSTTTGPLEEIGLMRGEIVPETPMGSIYTEA